MRILRRLLIAFGALVALGLVANVYATRAAERAAAKQIKTSLKLTDEPTVRFDAFPILLRMLQGEIPRATVDAHDVNVRGLMVSRFHIEVQGLKVSLADVTSGRGKLTVGGGGAYGEVTEASVNAYLAKQGETARVRFVDGAVRVRSKTRYGGRDHVVDATGSLTIDGADLVFTPKTVTVDGKPPPAGIAARARRDAAIEAPLPPLPGGVRPKEVSVGDGSARLEVAFDATTLDLSKL